MAGSPSLPRTAPGAACCARSVTDVAPRQLDEHVLEVGDALERARISFDLTLLFGGQIAGGRTRLFMIYSAGNFIEATQDTPYLQIGEHKYGKPVLDRAVAYDTSVDEALKLALVSMDSTMRSNLGVGLPIDIAVLPRDQLSLEVDHRIDNADPYFHDLRDRWSVALRAAHMSIPRPPYLKKLPPPA